MAEDRPVDHQLARLLRAGSDHHHVRDATCRRLMIAYLEGGRIDGAILGDFLLQEGKTPPATVGGALGQRVRRLLAVLPPWHAHGIAGDFVDHLFATPGALVYDELFRGMAVKRRWLDGAATDAELKRVRILLGHFPKGAFGVDATLQLMSASPSPTVVQRVASVALRDVGHLPARPYPLPRVVVHDTDPPTATFEGSHGWWRYGAKAFVDGATTEARWQAAHLTTVLRDWPAASSRGA